MMATATGRNAARSAEMSRPIASSARSISAGEVTSVDPGGIAAASAVEAGAFWFIARFYALSRALARN